MTPSKRSARKTPEAFLAYFLRVDSAYGLAQIKSQMETRESVTAADILLRVASLHTNNDLEKYAVSQLYGSSSWIVCDAAKALGISGSAVRENVCTLFTTI